MKLAPRPFPPAPQAGAVEPEQPVRQPRLLPVRRLRQHPEAAAAQRRRPRLPGIDFIKLHFGQKL
jgi:hypothetical protein